MNIGVVIATYGDFYEWEPMITRAQDSVNRQTLEPVSFAFHGSSLQYARNNGALALTSMQERWTTEPIEWLIFLDADDELDAGYVEAMAAAAEAYGNKRAIYRPATLGVHPDGHEDDAPVMIERRDLAKSNFIVIGAMCPADLFFEIGGFSGDEVLEDWDCWIRMVAAGAPVYDVPDAIYRVHVNPNGRNANAATHGRVYTEIRSRYA